MKKLPVRLIFNCVILSTILYSCSTKRNLAKEMISNDFVQLVEGDSIYFSKYEITNIQYKEFLNDIKRQDPELYERCKVEPQYWVIDFPKSYNNPMERNYFSHYYFDYYPVVNIPFLGAIEYCNWLNRKLNTKDKNVYFRLPQEKEFMKLINTVTVKFDSDNVVDYKELNFNLKFEGNYVADASMYPVVSNDKFDEKSYRKNKYIQNPFGVSHVVGNVQELLASGNYIGGGWDSFPSEVYKVREMIRPDSRVGFRIVMVKENANPKF